MIDKIRGRGAGQMLFADWLDDIQSSDEVYGKLHDLRFTDAVALLNRGWDQGAQILVEGTQGTLLDLHLGPYPYTTHKQTQVASWLAEAGLSPTLPIEVCLVARTFPIRVAGNSGPMPGEISWVALANEINGKLAFLGRPPLVQFESLKLFESMCEIIAREEFNSADWRIESWTQEKRELHPEFCSELHKRVLDCLPYGVVNDLCRLFEMTTVTNKLRRVAHLHHETLEQSIQLNRPTYLAMTFANYLFPEVWGQDFDAMPSESYHRIHDWAMNLESHFTTEVRYFSTGPKTEHVLEVEG